MHSLADRYAKAARRSIPNHLVHSRRSCESSSKSLSNLRVYVRHEERVLDPLETSTEPTRLTLNKMLPKHTKVLPNMLC